MDQQRSVLIVDRSEETREVLQTALNRRGVRTFTARHASEGAELDRRHHPDLVVLDLDVDDVNLGGPNPPFWALWEEKNIPIIMLGSLSRRHPQIPGSEFVSKPYHYGPLVRRIEERLNK